MSEYICLIRDENEHHTTFTRREEIVRCRDCNSASFDEFGCGWCNENCREIKAWNFCAWAERRAE